MKTPDTDGLRLDYLIEKDCTLYQNPDHFCFNSDTVALAQFAKFCRGQRILEIGTNNGALLLWADRFDPDYLCGVEVLAEPAKLALLNMQTFARHDWAIYKMPIREFDKTEFDLILCNPPYFQPNIHEGLKSQPDLQQVDARTQARFGLNLSLQEMIQAARKALKSQGKLCFVCRPDRIFESMTLLKEENFALSRLKIVYDARDEQAKIFLAEAVKDGTCQPVIEPAGWFGKKKA